MNAARLSKSRIVSFVHSALRRITGSWLAGTQLTAASLLFFRILSTGYVSPLPATFVISGVVITEITAFCLLLALAVAHEIIARGARPWLTYATTLLAAAAVSGVLQWYVRLWVGLQVVIDNRGVSLAIRKMNMLYTGLDALVCGALIVLIYLHRQRELHCLRQVETLQLQQRQTEQALMTSRLLVTQTEIDPEELVTAMGRIRTLYEHSMPAAETALEAFIEQLRIRLALTRAAVEAQPADLQT